MSKKLEVVKPQSSKKLENLTMRNAPLSGDRGPEASSPDQQLAEKIRDFVDAAGGRKRAAEAMSVSVTTLDNYREGQTQPRFLEMLSLAAAANRPLSEVLSGTEFARLMRPRPEVPRDSIYLPRYDIRASAGRGALVQSENVAEFFSVGRDWLRRQLPAWAPVNSIVGILEGSGDSMEPTIRDGDLIMIVQDPPWRTVQRGGIFIFALDDLVHIKRLQQLISGDLHIISDNPAYKPETILHKELEHRFRLLGYVFHTGGPPRSPAEWR